MTVGDNKAANIHCDNNVSVERLKLLVKQELYLSNDDTVSLLFNGKPLFTGKTIDEYGVKDGDTLTG